MPKEVKVQQFKQLYESFLTQNPHEIEAFTQTYSDYDGPNLDETKSTMMFCLQSIQLLLTSDTSRDLSWHAFNSLQGVFQNVYNTYAQLKASRDQGSFQNFAIHLDSLAYHIRMFGIPLLALGGGQIEKKAAALNSELERLASTRTEVETLRNEVKALIAPAVAGSLSEAFTVRRNTLLWGRIVWGVVALFVGAYCIHATYGFASAVGDAITISQAGKSVESDFIWMVLLIRSAILIPLFAAFGFSFSQYKKERDFEEEYAHKAAVATSLPNYGDLTREPAVRDQIVTGATNVIFTSPTAKSVDSSKDDKTLSGMKDILDSIGKLIPKRD
jgi:hypothetical protein